MNGTDHDAEILRLFRQWVAGRRALDQIGRQHPEKDCTDIPEWNALDADIAALEHRLADIPAGGASGLAVKAYLAAYHEHWGSDEDAAALCGIYRESFGDNPEQHPCAHLECALLRDAGRLVPEIAPLVVRVTQDRAEPGNAAEGEAASDEEGGEAEAEIGFGPYPCPAGPEPAVAVAPPPNPALAAIVERCDELMRRAEREPDAALRAAELEIARLRKLGLESDEADEVRDPIWNKVFAMDGWIARTAAETLADAAVKLRRLCDLEIGIEAGEVEHDIGSLRQVLAVVEREAAAAP